MSQHDLVIDNASGATVRTDINNALQALGSIQAGASAPSTTYAYMLWGDTTNNLLKIRNAANSAWIDTGITLNADRTITGNTFVDGDLDVDDQLRINYGSTGWRIVGSGLGSPFAINPDASGTPDTAKGLSISRSTGLLTLLNGLTVNGADLTLGGGVGLVFPDASEQVRAAHKIVVHQTVKTDTFTMTSATYADVTGLSVTFTPVSASSVMLVLLSMQAATDASYGAVARLLRDATPIDVGAAGGSRIVATAAIPQSPSGGVNDNSCYTIGAVYYDEPATASSVTYKVQVARLYTAGTVAVNRSAEDTDDAYHSRQASSLVVVEIA